MKVSPNNIKIGNIPNMSMPPALSCNPDVVKYCGRKNECYAFKAWTQYANVRTAWQHNYNQYKGDPTQFEIEFSQFLSNKQPKMFRYFVGGDCPNIEFAKLMVKMAVNNPNTQFLSFTKQYSIWNAFDELPANLNIVYSTWPNWEFDNPFNRPVAYMQDGNESRITDDTMHCSGQCDQCGVCWYLKPGKRVYFDKH